MSTYTDNNTMASRTKKAKKILANPGKHIMNKNESKKLRQLMVETGLSEAELRADKKYCKILSEAQKVGTESKASKTEKFYRGIIKAACMQSKLVPQHPETLKIIEELLKNYKNRWFGRNYSTLLSAKKVVELYAK